MIESDLSDDRGHHRLLKSLGVYRLLHTMTTNPVFILLCILTGPPGWIFLLMVGPVFSLPEKRVQKLVSAAESYLHAGDEQEALRFADAALSIDHGKKEALSVKSRCFHVAEMVPLAEWPTATLSRLEIDLHQEIDAADGAGCFLTDSSLGQVLFDDQLLAYVHDLPRRCQDVAEQAGWARLSEDRAKERIDGMLPGGAKLKYTPVEWLGEVEDEPKIMAVATADHDIVLVNRTRFDYVRCRHPEWYVVRLVPAGPVMFIDKEKDENPAMLFPVS